MMKLHTLFLAAAAGACFLADAAPVGAQANHLKCYAIKDQIVGPTPRTADLVGLAPEPGCKIKGRARQLCVPTTKTNVNPPPPGGGPNPPSAQRYLCYRARCPVPPAPLPAVPSTDQFGSRPVLPRRAFLLCAPASPSGAFIDASTDIFG